MENKNNLVVIVGGLLIVTAAAAGIVGFSSGKKEGISERTEMMKTSVTKEMDHSALSMDQMTEGLKGKSGDAFDRAFIEMMIVHHQGAVDMAVLIPANAKHDELKKLGQEIVTAQTKEIALMKQWMKDWGYMGQSESMDHTMMPGMQH